MPDTSFLWVMVTRSDCVYCLAQNALRYGHGGHLCARDGENPTEPSDKFDIAHSKELFDHRVWS